MTKFKTGDKIQITGGNIKNLIGTQGIIFDILTKHTNGNRYAIRSQTNQLGYAYYENELKLIKKGLHQVFNI